MCVRADSLEHEEITKGIHYFGFHARLAANGALKVLCVCVAQYPFANGDSTCGENGMKLPREMLFHLFIF